MPLFEKRENLSGEERKLSVVTFWLFVVAVFAWVVPYTMLFVLQLTSYPVSGALKAALLPSLATFGVTVALCAIVYLIYRKAVLKL